MIQEKRIGFHTRLLADSFTVFRSFLGLALVGLGMVGKSVLSMASVLVLLAWISDFLDGPLARRDPDHPITWIGRHDLEADMTAAGGTWIYLFLSGFVPWSLFMGVILLTAGLYIWSRSIHITSAFMAISYGTMIGVSLWHVLSYGYALVGWLLILILITWPRFLQKADEFIQGMVNLIK